MAHNYKRSLLSTLVLSALYHSAVAEVITDGSVGQQVDIQAPDNVYEISADLGRTSGNNLFHSFTQFNVEQGYTANFSGPANIQNIISRVTGPDASHIDGTLQSSIQGANLFLLNPNGVLFGSTASLNISGSFYASTADYVKFGENDYFYSDPAKQSTFVSAEPSAFGFISNAPNKIEATGSQLSVTEGNSLSFIGGDINLDGAQLNAVNGTVNIASVASSGEVTRSVEDTNTAQFNELGNISLSNSANIDTSGSSGGRIVIRGGNLTLDNSNIAANTTGDLNTNTAEGISVVLTKDLVVDNNSHLSTNVIAGASAQSSGIAVSAANATINNNSSIESLTQKPSTGAGGSIVLDIDDHLGLTNQSRISTQTAGEGKSGNISVTAHSLELTTASYISTSAVTSIPRVLINSSAGDIHIDADIINMRGLDKPRFSATNQNLDFTGITADDGFRGGDSGNIDIKTREMTMDNNAFIHSLVYRQGNTAGDINVSAPNGRLTMLNGASIFGMGDINITADDILVSGVSVENVHNTVIATNARNGLPTGDVRITGKTIRVDNGARISAQQYTTENSGSVVLTADEITITGINKDLLNYWLANKGAESALKSARTTVGVYNTAGIAPGQHIAGNVEINAKDFYLTDHAELFSVNRGQIFPGNININATGKAVFDNSLLSTSSDYGVGIGGDVNIQSRIAVFNHNSVETTAIEGVGGNINISAKSILVSPDSVFNASSQFSVDGNISFNSNVDIEKSVNALPNSVADATKEFTEDCSVRADKYSRFKTTRVFSGVNAANALLFSNYALNYDNQNTVATSSSSVPNGLPTNNWYDTNSLLSGVVPTQFDCSHI